MAKSRGVGTTLQIGTGNTAKTVGGLNSIDGISVSAEEVDVTALDNSTGYREFLQGFKDGGEISLGGYLDGTDTGQNEMYTLLESGTVTDMAIIFPTAIGKTWSFTAFVKEFSTSIDVDGAVEFAATLRVSGKPTLAATGSGG